jgi:WD40 repeat protein
MDEEKDGLPQGEPQEPQPPPDGPQHDQLQPQPTPEHLQPTPDPLSQQQQQQQQSLKPRQKRPRKCSVDGTSSTTVRKVIRAFVDCYGTLKYTYGKPKKPLAKRSKKDTDHHHFAGIYSLIGLDGDTQSLTWVDMESGEPLTSIFYDAPVHCISVDALNSRMICCWAPRHAPTPSFRLDVWDLEANVIVNQLHTVVGSFQSLNLRGNFLLFGGVDGSYSYWDMRTMSPIFGKEGVPRGFLEGSSCVHQSDDNSMIFVAVNDAVKVLDSVDGTVLTTVIVDRHVDITDNETNDICGIFVNQTNTMYGVWTRKILQIHDSKSSQKLGLCDCSDWHRFPGGPLFGPDDQIYCSVGNDKCISWDFITGTTREIMMECNGTPVRIRNIVAFNPCSQRFFGVDSKGESVYTFDPTSTGVISLKAGKPCPRNCTQIYCSASSAGAVLL